MVVMKAKYYIHGMVTVGDTVTVEYCHQTEWDYFEETGWENFELVVKTIQIEDIAQFMKEHHLNEFENEDGETYRVHAGDYFRTTSWDDKTDILSKYLDDDDK